MECKYYKNNQIIIDTIAEKNKQISMQAQLNNESINENDISLQNS